VAIFPIPEELYPDWRDWAKTLGQYLIDEEMERRRDVSQRLGRFFIHYHASPSLLLSTEFITTARAPFKLISCINSWNNTTAGGINLTLSRVTPPSTSVAIEWAHGTPATLASPETAVPSQISAITEGLCTANCEISAGDILQLFQFNPTLGGIIGFTIEAEDLSWNL